MDIMFKYFQVRWYIYDLLQNNWEEGWQRFKTRHEFVIVEIRWWVQMSSLYSFVYFFMFENFHSKVKKEKVSTSLKDTLISVFK